MQIAVPRYGHDYEDRQMECEAFLRAIECEGVPFDRLDLICEFIAPAARLVGWGRQEIVKAVIGLARNYLLKLEADRSADRRGNRTVAATLRNIILSMVGICAYHAPMSKPDNKATIGSYLDAGMSMIAQCGNCGKHARLDLEAIAARLGRDHSPLAVDLRPHFRCSDCGAREAQFSVIGYNADDYRNKPSRRIS